MEIVHILKVALLSDDRLGVFPEQQKAIYQYIYREAAGVYWDNGLGCFHSTVPNNWNYRDWYQQTVSVVRTGLGIRLRLSPAVIFVGGEEHFGNDIIAADMSVQRWIDDGCPAR